jgi:hypothetical protein
MRRNVFHGTSSSGGTRRSRWSRARRSSDTPIPST